MRTDLVTTIFAKCFVFSFFFIYWTFYKMYLGRISFLISAEQIGRPLRSLWATEIHLFFRSLKAKAVNSKSVLIS